MKTKIVDASGLSCPEPVVLVNNAIKDNYTSLEIIVDNIASKENVTRLLQSNKYKITEIIDDNNIILKANKN